MKTICYKENEQEILKYEVYFDEKKVRLIRDELLLNCCLKKKRKISSSTWPFEKFYIKNIQEGQKLGIKDYNDALSETYYEYTFDEYKPTDIVESLTNILNNEMSYLKNIFESSRYICPRETLEKRIEILNISLNNIPNTNIELKIKTLKELEDLLNQKKLNENQKSEKEYEEKVKALFNFKLLSSIPKSTIASVCNFFDNSLTFEDIKNQYLTRTKK